MNDYLHLTSIGTFDIIDDIWQSQTLINNHKGIISVTYQDINVLIYISSQTY